MVRVVESASNELRLAEARAFVRSNLRNADLLLVGASRGAADDLARSIAIESGATVGLHRFSLTQLAARLAAPILAADRRSPATDLGIRSGRCARNVRIRPRRCTRVSAPLPELPGFRAHSLEHCRSCGSPMFVLSAFRVAARRSRSVRAAGSVRA